MGNRYVLFVQGRGKCVQRDPGNWRSDATPIYATNDGKNEMVYGCDNGTIQIYRNAALLMEFKQTTAIPAEGIDEVEEETGAGVVIIIHNA